MELQHQFYDMLQQSQYWSADEMQAHQRSQLSQLLHHAKANTDFYKTRLDPVFGSNGEIDWERWQEIPILKRSDLLESRAAMLARNVPAGHGELKDFSSTGSTGKKVTVTFTGLASIASQATIFRAQAWHGIDWSKNCLSWLIAEAGQDPSKVETLSPWGPVWDDAAQAGTFFEYPRQNKAEEVLDYLRATPASYIYTRPRSAQELALAALQRGDELSIDRMLAVGSGIADDVRADCERAFGSRFLANYSAAECSCIASQCPTGDHYHVNSEIMLCEILNDQDQPCAPGEMGRVIVTPFYYTAQPIIRYELGDMAIPGQTCSCGRKLPVIDEILGRITHLFRFPDGRVIAPTIPNYAQDILQSHYWQFVQTAPLEVKVKYVPKDWDAFGDETAMTELVRQSLHPNLKVVFERVREIKPSLGSKYIEFLSELPAAK